MLGFFSAAGETFTDDFSSLPWRNGRPSGANKLRNSEFHAATVGTAVTSAAPVPWGIPENAEWYVGAGLTATIIAIGTTTINSQTVRTMDIRVQGTATDGSCYLTVETTRHHGGYCIPAASGQVWTSSGYVALVAGSATGFTLWAFKGNARTAPDNYGDETQPYQVNISTFTGTLARVVASVTCPANTIGMGFSIQIFCNTGTAVNATFRIAGMQLEQAATATGYVPTTSHTGQWNSEYPWGPEVTLNAAPGAMAPDGPEVQYFPNISLEGTAKSNGVNPFDTTTEAGVLRITGTAQSNLPVSNDGRNVTRTHLSGAMSTFYGFAQRYGYWEMRARMPSTTASGMWPAFWLGEHRAQGNAEETEVDVVEWYGKDPNEVTCAAHYGVESTDTGFVMAVTAGEPSNQFNTYGFEARDDKLVWYYNRRPYFTINTPASLKGPRFMMLNMAMGSWSGPINAAALPTILRIDYVRVWDKLPF